MTSEVNHFARLGINTGASENEIKKAYRALAMRWHPDKNNDVRAKETFQEIAASYEFLSSKDRREMHERELNKRAPEATNNGNMKTPKKSSASPPEKMKKTSTPSWSQSFTKCYHDQQRQQSKNRHRKTFIFTSTSESDLDDFSFIFRNGKGKMPFTSMTDEADILDEQFREAKVGKQTTELHYASNKKQQHRHVAPETGDISGLDNAYLFSTRQQPEQDRFEDKLPCPWCGSPFSPGKLFQHEEKCGKFGLSADEDEDSDCDVGCLTQFAQPGLRSMSVWQYQHEQLIRQIQRDKENYQNRLDRCSMTSNTTVID